MAGAPFPEDFFERVVNVQWGGGGDFVAALDDGTVYVGKSVADKEPKLSVEWTKVEVTIPGSNDTYGFMGGSSAAMINDKSVFVIGGSYNNAGADFSRDGVAFVTSSDGKDWQETFNKDFYYSNGDHPGPPDYGEIHEFYWYVSGIVWDGSAFVAAIYTTRQNFIRWDFGEIEITEGEIFYRSSNGYSWSKSGENMVDPAATIGPSALPLQHGQPDGVQYHDKKQNFWAKPTSILPYIIQGIGYGGGTPAKSVTIEKLSGEPSPPPSSVSAPCRAVAGVVGYMVAGGDGAIDISLDNGATWEKSLTFSGKVVSIVACDKNGR